MIRDYLRTLTVAALALSVVAIPGADTVLKPKRGGDSGVRCTYYNRVYNEWDYMLPGDIIVVKDGNGNLVYLICGNDGKWSVMQNGHKPPTNGGGGGGGNWKP